MYLSNNKEFKYRKWIKKFKNNSFFFERVCDSHSKDIFNAYIFKAEDSISKIYRCEVPMLFNSNKSIAIKNLYIKKIKEFNTLEKAAMWVDLYLFKDLNSKIKFPFYFLWLEEENYEGHI